MKLRNLSTETENKTIQTLIEAQRERKRLFLRKEDKGT